MLTFLREDFSLTKQHLGVILLVAGVLGLLFLLGIDPLTAVLHRLGSDLLPPDRQTGIGPAQMLAIIAAVLVTIMGATLIPLGKEGSAVSLERVQPVLLPRLWRIVTRALLWVVMALMLFYLLIYVVYAVNIISFPFDYDQGEGFELVDTIMFSQFRWPYQDTETFPFYSSNYPPLFHIIAVPFVWLFGPAYWYGRLLGFLGTLVTAGAIAYAVHRAERHRFIAVISGLAYLASNYIYHVGPLFRQHLFMVMFETLAVVVLANVHDVADKRQRRRILFAGIGLLLAAGYTKQLAISTCVAVFLYLFIYSPRRSLGWGVFFAGIAGAIFFAIDVATGGQWWLNIITANVNPFVPGQFQGLLRQWFGLHGVLIILAGLLTIYELYFDRVSIFSVWFGVAALSTTLAGKWGAGDSYFATAIAAICILSGIFAARTVKGTWRLPDNYLTRLALPVRQAAATRPKLLAGIAGIIVPILYLLYGAAVFHMPTEGAVFGEISDALGIEPNTDFALYDSAGWTIGYAVIGQIPTDEDIANGWELVDIVAEGNRPAISEDASFSLLAGKEVVGNPTQLRNLYNNGLYDSTELNAMLEAQDFHVLVLRAFFYPDPVLYTMMEAYQLDETIPMNGFDYRVYRPDSEWPERQALRDQIHAVVGEQVIDQVIPMPRTDIAEWLGIIFDQIEWVPEGDWRNDQIEYVHGESRVAVYVVPESGAAGESVRIRIEPAS